VLRHSFLNSNNTRQLPSILVQQSAYNGAWKRAFMASQISAVRSGSLLKAPRWVYSKSEQDSPPPTTPQDSEDEDGSVEQEGEEVVGKLDKTDSEPSSTSDRSSFHDVPDSHGPSSPPSSSSSSNAPPPPSQASSGSGSSIAKQSVPELYPQMLALPIARRPLLPFTKLSLYGIPRRCNHQRDDEARTALSRCIPPQRREY